MTFVDTHAHVHDKAFDSDREQAVRRMHDAGVRTAVLVGCDLADSAAALDVAQRYGLYASAGVHPHEAKDAPSDLESAFAPLLDRGAIAIGETGLDYYYDHSPRDAQAAVLRAQIRLAAKQRLPVIFHHRDAFEDFSAILRQEWQPSMRGVIHCFTGDASQARTYVKEFGLFLGIGGAVTFKSAEQIREAVRAVGLKPLVLETDCPYLAPAPHRGTRNEPAMIPVIAQRVADVTEAPLEEVASVTSANAVELFGSRFRIAP